MLKTAQIQNNIKTNQAFYALVASIDTRRHFRYIKNAVVLVLMTMTSGPVRLQQK